MAGSRPSAGPAMTTEASDCRELLPCLERVAACVAELVERELAVLVGVGGGEAGAALGEELLLGQVAIAGFVDRLEGGLGARQRLLQLRPARFARPIDGAAQRRLERIEGEIALVLAVELVEARSGEGLRLGGRDGAVTILVDELDQAGEAVLPRRRGAVLGARRQRGGEKERGGEGGKVARSKSYHCCSSCWGFTFVLCSRTLPTVASPPDQRKSRLGMTRSAASAGRCGGTSPGPWRGGAATPRRNCPRRGERSSTFSATACQTRPSAVSRPTRPGNGAPQEAPRWGPKKPRQEI